MSTPQAAQRLLDALAAALPYAPHRAEFDIVADAADDLRAALKRKEEAALKADACIEALRAIVEQQRSMGFDGSPSDELMDEARRALAAVGAA